MRGRVRGAVAVAVVVVVSAGLVVLSGCGGTSAETKKTSLNAGFVSEFDGAPDWVRKGCSAYFGDRKDVICGVGSAGGTRNVSLARSAAMGRARTEIARSLTVKIQSMLKIYGATTTGGESYGTAANDEQNIVDAARQLTDISLSGTKLEDTWISPNGNLYTLVSLDLDAFKGALSRMTQLNESVRKAVEERAAKAFQELDEQLGKRPAQPPAGTAGDVKH